LVLQRGEEHRVEAEAKTGRDGIKVQVRQVPVTPSELPESLFRYVIRTQQKIILDDASANNMFSEDNYLRQRHPRSILCLPLVRQTKILGVLYLENNLAPRVFTQKRLAMLELLASQAAISLDHARVYAELAQENSERKRAEEELRRSEAFLAQGQRISHTGSWRWHVATGTVHWSEETFRIFGANPNTEKPAYSLFMERVHPEDRTRVEAILNRAAQDKSDFDFDYRIVLSNGLIKFLRSVGQPMVSSSGELEFIGTVMDITDHKRAEEAWRKAQAQLAHVTRVTTLGELAGSIAHEVKQPLTAIINNAEACLGLLPSDTNELDDLREALSDIVTDADRASTVITRIRGMAKKAPPQKSRLDLNETIGEVIAMARGELERNRVLLRTRLANDLPLIMGDRIHLQQVMLNLIINSIEAMSAASEGTRELWVSSEKVTAAPGESKQDGLGSNTFASPDTGNLEVERGTRNAERRTPNACILVSVADSGPGLDLNNMDRLFDAFYTTKPQGLGMGLSISRSIIEAHGGRLWANANVPKGALFQFTLPIAND